MSIEEISETEKLDRTLSFKETTSEYRRIKKEAKKLKMTVSEYLRYLVSL